MKKENKLNVKSLVGTVSLMAIVTSFGGSVARSEDTRRDLASGNEVSTNGYDNYYLEYMSENYLHQDPKKMKEARRRTRHGGRDEYDEEEIEVIDEQEYVGRGRKRKTTVDGENDTCVACSFKMQKQRASQNIDEEEEEEDGDDEDMENTTTVARNNAQNTVVSERTEIVEEVRTERAGSKSNTSKMQNKSEYESYEEDVEEDDEDEEEEDYDEEVENKDSEKSRGLFYSYYGNEDEEDAIVKKKSRKNSDDGDVGGSKKESEEDEIRRRDRDYDETSFYIKAIAGKGRLGKYKMTIDKDAPVNMKNDKNKLDISVALGWSFPNKWDVEIEGEKIDWKDIKPETKINDSLIDYDHKIKTLSAGINAIYNLADYRDSWLTPFVGFGVGMTQFKLADYGSAWTLNGSQLDGAGEVVTQNTPGAEQTVFESNYEKKTKPYAKLIAGFTLRLSDYTSLILKGDYKLFDNIKYSMFDGENNDTINMKISSLSTITAGAGLRINF